MRRPDWVPDTVFYQIFPDRFRNSRPDLDPPGTQPWGTPPDRVHFQGGDLAGITESLGHLETLGVSGLYLNPIFTAGTNHRYDTHDYFTVDPHLGDLGGLRELVTEAHSKGIRVILDGVFNHCGDSHPAFVDWQVNGDQGEHAGWFTGWPGPQPAGEPAYQTCGGAAYLPKLNTENPEVREHLLRCATFWIEEAGIDGWRLDVPWKVEGGFWDEFTKTMETYAPDAYIVGEVWRNATPYLNHFHGCTNYLQRGAIFGFCLGGSLDGEDFMIEVDHLVDRHGDAADWMLNLVGSHDTPRLRTIAGDPQKARLASTAMFTLPGVPLIYYGDEIGLEGGDDPDCRRAMPWDPTKWDHQQFDHVRSLIQTRKEHAALRRGGLQRLAERNGLVAFLREHDGDQVIVILNARGAQRHLRLPVSGTWREVGEAATHTATENGLAFDEIPGMSAVILAREGGHR